MVLGLVAGCNHSTGPPVSVPKVEDAPVRPPLAEQVASFCGGCHPTPPPSTFPRANWDHEVRRGYDFHRKSGRELEPPPIQDVIAYYQNAAPEDLPTIPATPDGPGPSRSLTRIEVPGPDSSETPAISSVSLARLSSPDRPDILATDLASGELLIRRADRPDSPMTILATELGHPAHVEVVDLDRDGVKDLLVADLGTPIPSDERVGRVLWLRGNTDGSYETRVLLSRVGRVCDVQAADFDGDGDLDLVVAVFGWHVAGEILWLEQRTGANGAVEFARKPLDDRHGTLQVPVVDLNQDGRPDFVALIAQEHESVVAFLNQGQGRFTKVPLFTAPHPAYGSSGIQMVDMDEDGDLDAVTSNGDVYDSPLLKPYHGVSWLENKGLDRPFERHEIGAVYGCHRAMAGDIDGDGDLDVVASSFLGESYYGAKRQAVGADALILFEQTAPGQFRRHALERLTCDYPSVVLGDIDQDGRLEIVAGRFRNFQFAGSKTIEGARAPLVIWK